MKIMVMATTVVLCLLLILSAAGLALDINIGDGDIRIRTGIEAPPRVEFDGPPELLPIPGRYVYFVPDIDSDLFFYHSRWYRPYRGRWFRSENYAGPWEHVREVPPALMDLPRDYRTIPPGYSRVPYGELRNNWERWEREKYWDRRGEDRGIRGREREREERDIRRAGREDWRGGIRTRIHEANQRIEQGIENGSLTRHEAKKLKGELGSILRRIDRMKEDGQLSQKEREKIDRNLDRLDRDITKEKRDDDHRRR